jgi:hypothetical protein
MRKIGLLSAMVIGALSGVSRGEPLEDLFKVPPKMERVEPQAPLFRFTPFSLRRDQLNMLQPNVPSNWLSREFNGIRFYIVPVAGAPSIPLTPR